VLMTALRLLGKLELAQDAAQEVFLRLHKYLRRYNEAREFSPWLYQVTLISFQINANISVPRQY
jgi:DNA-directed RNA polymerase specialized sigma24 family protein